MRTSWNELHSWPWGRNSPVPLFCSIHVLRQAIIPYMIRFKEELVIPPPKGHDKTQHNQLHHHRKKPSIHVVGQECDNVILLSRDEYNDCTLKIVMFVYFRFLPFAFAYGSLFCLQSLSLLVITDGYFVENGWGWGSHKTTAPFEEHESLKRNGSLPLSKSCPKKDIQDVGDGWASLSWDTLKASKGSFCIPILFVSMSNSMLSPSNIRC